MKANVIENIIYNNFLTTGLANYTSISTVSNTKIIQYKVQYEETKEEPIRMRYSYVDIANWFLKKSLLTITKLQLLCYYTQAWGYATNNYLVIDTIFYATSNGPASKDIALFFDDHNNELITKSTSNLSYVFDIETMELLESVWLTYGNLSTNALISLSESELPWIEAYKKQQINEKEIIIEIVKEFYKSISTK